jgi:hypothetical protein
MKKLITFVLFLVLAGCSREQPRGTIRNLRGMEWGMEQGEAIVVTNVAGLPGGGDRDYMFIKDNHQKRHFGYISVTGQWVEVYYPPYARGLSVTQRPGDYSFPQRDATGTPVAMAMPEGGTIVTHIFTNGTWKESNQTGGR